MENLVKTYSTWGLHLELDLPVNFYVDTLCLEAKPEEKEWNVAYIIEPEEVVYKGFYSDFLSISDRFKYVLTDKEEILEACPHSVFFEYGYGWLDENPYPDKIFGISTLIGHKVGAPGHRLRHKIWNLRDQIKNPTYFYGSHLGGPPLEEGHDLIIKSPSMFKGGDRLFIYKTQFQIVIENIRTKYWFTEKLLDCFASKTVPIYFGAERIGDFFDSRGIILAENSDEIIQACNNINEKTYSNMLPYVEENCVRARKYLNHPKRITDKLTELFS